MCLVAAAAFPAEAQVTVGSQATPVATATASNGGPADITVDSSATLQPTTAAAPAVTLNSNNVVTNNGIVTFNNVNGSTGVLVQGGFTGAVTNVGTINNIEDFTPPDNNVDGVVESPLASGNTRYGVRVTGAAPFTGSITNTGSIFVEGNDSAGVSVEAPLVGSIIQAGTVGVTGDRSYGLHTTAPITGPVQITGAVSTSGQGSTAVSIGNDVSGAVSVYSAVSSNGFATSSRSITDSVLKTIQGTASEQLLSGPSMVIGGNLGGGLFIGAPPAATATASTADVDGDGIADGAEGVGALSSFSSSPSLLIGGTGRSVTLSPFGTGSNAYGLIVRGSVTSLGLYDGISATGIQVGGTGSAASLIGGFRLTGATSATAYESASTGLVVGAGGSVPVFQNENSITASTLYSTVATAHTTAAATAVLVQPGGSLPAVVNLGTIAATGAGPTVSAAAITDQSGTLSSIANQGLITASVTPGVTGGTTSGSAIALDLRSNTSGVSLVQSVNAAPITLSGSTDDNGVVTVTGTTPATPAIVGDVLLGNGPNTVQLLGGTETGALSLGSGPSSLTVANGAVFTGALTHTGSGLTVSVPSGTLTNTSPVALQTASLDIGATGAVSIAIDPANNRSGGFLVTGPATIASGAKVGINLLSGIGTPQTFTLISSPQLNIGSIASLEGTVPYAAVASLSVNNAIGALTVSLRQRTAAEAGLNPAEAAALQAVYAALPADAAVQNALYSQTDRAGFIGVYDQLLPDYAGGVFRLASVASRAVSRGTSDADGPWVQEYTVGTRLSAGNGATPFHGLGLGVAGGFERNSSIGVVGVTASLFTGDVRVTKSPGDNRASESQVEGGVTWRTDLGGLRLDGRAAGGFVSYNYRRELKLFDATGATSLDRLANGKSTGYSLAGHFGGSYRAQLGRWYVQPEAHLDYFRLTSGAYSEVGGGSAFDLNVAARTGQETSATVSVRAGGSFGSDFTWRPELEFGYREIITGSPGVTTASFAGGQPFTLSPADIQKGGAFGRFGFAAGNDLYDLSIAAGAEMRGGYTEGDLHVRVRLLF
ncbi:MAG TPA: autotransporter outer membrane beta-barrel domain-containing protein [Caulobacteraceae bacterium]|nr:autotransporter outer membrane beta-barrel domain-containing protein [Caulobacteraceae bacterium]